MENVAEPDKEQKLIGRLVENGEVVQPSPAPKKPSFFESLVKGGAAVNVLLQQGMGSIQLGVDQAGNLSVQSLGETLAQLKGQIIEQRAELIVMKVAFEKLIGSLAPEQVAQLQAETNATVEKYCYHLQKAIDKARQEASKPKIAVASANSEFAKKV